MNCLFFVICTFFTVILHVDDFDDGTYTCKDSPSLVEANSRLNQADQAWATFENEIEWFLEYSKPCKDLNGEDDPDIEQYNSLVQGVYETKDEFLKFRDQTANCALINNGNTAPGLLSYSLSMLEMTRWYVNYMEQLLFPSDWEILFQAYLKEKTSPIFEQSGADISPLPS